MSSVEADEACASCGKVEVDDVKLKKCSCKLVRYCSVECQKNHRPQHKKACKKRMAKIRNDALFAQPEISCYGECPICCLPMPLDKTKSSMMSCCSKFICNGCHYANTLRELEKILECKCPFCRELVPETKEEDKKASMKRAKANDPAALSQLGCICDEEGDYEKAFEYYTKAAALGNMDAHHNLSVLYRGEGKVEKNKKKEIYHLEEAAIGGHPDARFNLGCYEGNAGRHDIAMRHFIISANLGHDDGLEEVKMGFQRGYVSKEDYAASLRGHQAAVDATKSKQRNVANTFFDKCRRDNK